MNPVYRKILFAFGFLVWIGGMCLVFYATDNSERAEAIRLSVKNITQKSYFLPVFLLICFLFVMSFAAPLIISSWQQNHLKQRLTKEGVRASVTIISVEDTQVTANKNPRVRITVDVFGEQASFDLTVSRIAIPRPGDRIEILYDPNDYKKAVYAGN